MKQLLELGDFVRKLYLHRRFGQLSPLSILRIEIKGTLAECDWLGRSRCTWDADRSPMERDHNASLWMLEDALAVRKLLFCVLPEVECAILRVYRRGSDDQLELVIGGTVRRGEQAGKRIRSLAMKGKLCGLQFRMRNGGLEALQTEDWDHGSALEFSGDTEVLTNGGSVHEN